MPGLTNMQKRQPSFLGPAWLVHEGFVAVHAGLLPAPSKRPLTSCQTRMVPLPSSIGCPRCA